MIRLVNIKAISDKGQSNIHGPCQYKRPYVKPLWLDVPIFQKKSHHVEVPLLTGQFKKKYLPLSHEPEFETLTPDLLIPEEEKVSNPYAIKIPHSIYELIEDPAYSSSESGETSHSALVDLIHCDGLG